MPLLLPRSSPQGLALLARRLLPTFFPLASAFSSTPARPRKAHKISPLASISSDFMLDSSSASGVVPWACVQRWLKSVNTLASDRSKAVSAWKDPKELLAGPLATSAGFTSYELANKFDQPAIAVSLAQLRTLRAAVEAETGASPQVLREAWENAKFSVFPGTSSTTHTFDSADELSQWIDQVQEVRKEMKAARKEKRAAREAEMAPAGMEPGARKERGQNRPEAEWASEEAEQLAADGPAPSKAAVSAFERTLQSASSTSDASPSALSPATTFRPKPSRIASAPNPTLASASLLTPSTRPPLPSSTVPTPSTSAPSARPLPPLFPQSSEPADLAEAKLAGAKQFELSMLRHAYERASTQGGAAFVSLDVEFWERDHDVLLEFGWSVVEFSRSQKDGKVKARREDQHVVVKENLRRRNGRFAPDARDHFDFGRSLILPQASLFHLLSALFSTLSATQPVYLIFHDPRGDLRALERLGFSLNDFETDLRNLGGATAVAAVEGAGAAAGGKKRKKRAAAFASPSPSPAPEGPADGPGKLWVVDTQRMFEAWIKRRCQVGLERACTEVEVPTKRLHNAGNDAHYTLDLFERLCDPARVVSPSSTLLVDLDERAARAAEKKAQRALEKEFEQVAAEAQRAEQARLKRTKTG
ncbi:hypothetical protein JCM8097_003000 [Rhodosporidiobolus ruineniae]